MFEPFAEKAFDVHSASLLRALPMALLMWLARQSSQTQTVLGASDTALMQTPTEINGLCALSKTQRDE
ncbi:MAG TPA: hypothetical protein VGQ11_04810 [Candidatus Acidoferrales bacterium]|nr:hypothetical protein [Candidatus Acidoferrales bacterium]